MLRKLSYVLGVAILLSSAPITGFSQDKPETEQHTGVKRTYNKAKHKVKRSWKKAKTSTKNTVNKAKARVKTDDTQRDQQERK
ncbi:MAG: hypothetical protein Q8916_14090 [Bacteroidota bacterium]|nr:hypothetical protein [Bacteroidota bacterium]MDP4231524.1 hypothetical protein [Bacteroidota bacterium]MDP4236655.1 hypothetical protein [Bacteroidota bacterium]